MTIINNRYKFIFVHVPKNAGTSVSNFLSQYSTPIDIEIGGTSFGELLQPKYREKFGIGKHTPAHKLLDRLPFIWNDYFKFAISRNPYARFYSAYSFLKNWTGHRNEELKKEFSKINNVNEFIKSNLILSHQIPDNIFNPQHYWICKNGSILLDEIIKLEDIDERVNVLLQKLKIPIQYDLKKLNSNPEGLVDFTKIYDVNSIDWISNYYQKDFLIFNYKTI